MGRLAHPDPFNSPAGPLELVVGAGTETLNDGDPTLGWPGDQRLALYINRQWIRWELWRLEADGVYRMTSSWPLADVRAGDIIGRCITDCLRSDQRTNNVHLHEQVLAANARAHRPVLDKLADQRGEAAERVAHAIKKDLG